MIRSKPNVRFALAALLMGLAMSACGKSNSSGSTGLNQGTLPGGGTIIPGGVNGSGCMQVGAGSVIPFVLQGAQLGVSTLTANQGTIALGGGGAAAQFSNQWRQYYGAPAGSFNLVQIQLNTTTPNTVTSGMGMMQLSQADASVIMSAGGQYGYGQAVCVSPIAMSVSFAGANLTAGRLYLGVYVNGASVGTYQANF